MSSLLLALAVLLTPAPRHLAAQSRFTADDLRHDLSLLRSSVEEAHAGLYVYRSESQVSHVFDSAMAALRDTTELGFFSTVTGILAQIRDGHTRSLPSERWMSWYSDSARVLPFRVRVDEGRAWITASADERLPRGTEVLAVDGRSMEELVSDMARHLPRDGDIQTGIAATLGGQFALFYYLFEARPAAFHVQVRSAGGNRGLVDAAAIPPSGLPPDPTVQRPMDLIFLDDSSVAVLRIATFAADEIAAAGVDYAAFLDSTFATILRARTTDLILDVRGNDGGRDTYGSLLLRHLMSRPFPYYRILEARTDRISFWRYTNLDSSFNTRFGGGLIRTGRGTYRLPATRHQNLGMQQPQLPVFAGRVWVLTDGGTFSTGAEFCAVARGLGRATFIGRETGGTYEGNASGTFAILSLPRTGVRVVIPLVRYILAVPPPARPGRGVIPDYEVQEGPMVDDRRAVTRALALIREARAHRGT